MRMRLGNAFNISVSGKTKKIGEKELSRQKQNKCTDIKIRRTYEAEITVNNAEDKNNEVVISQHFRNDAKIIKENIKSTEKNAFTRQWIVPTTPNTKATLSYTVEVTSTNQECN